MISLEDRINRDRITAYAEYRDGPPSYIDADSWSGDASWYDVTLERHPHIPLTVPFGMGSAHTEEPTAADVLNCLVLDAMGYENADGSFEEWASEYGYDTDSRRAYRTYQQVEKQTNKLRAFLGDEYDAYLYDTEQL